MFFLHRNLPKCKWMFCMHQNLPHGQKNMSYKFIILFSNTMYFLVQSNTVSKLVFGKKTKFVANLLGLMETEKDCKVYLCLLRRVRLSSHAMSVSMPVRLFEKHLAISWGSKIILRCLLLKMTLSPFPHFSLSQAIQPLWRHGFVLPTIASWVQPKQE